MLSISNITKKYRKGEKIFTALEDVSFKLDTGDFLSVTGPSGSGKSTLLNIIGGLIHPDSGIVSYEGTDIYSLPAKQIAEYRKNHVGFVFQQFHLLPYLTLYHNIRLSCHRPVQYERIGTLLEKCSLYGLEGKYPSELSVGEKQRAAFVRAIISEPSILLADEPTGNLDPDNSYVLMSLIRDFNKNGGTVIIVSHEPGTAPEANRHLILRSGMITDQVPTAL